MRVAAARNTSTASLHVIGISNSLLSLLKLLWHRWSQLFKLQRAISRMNVPDLVLIIKGRRQHPQKRRRPFFFPQLHPHQHPQKRHLFLVDVSYFLRLRTRIFEFGSDWAPLGNGACATKHKHKGSTSTKRPTTKTTKKDKTYYHQYRSNIISVQASMKGIRLTNAHLNAIKKPFWNFLKPFRFEDISANTRKHDGNVSDLISTYNTTTKTFDIGKKGLIITNNEVNLIFGIECGLEKMKPSRRGKSLTPFVNRRFLNMERLTAKAIKDVLLKTIRGKSKVDINDVARLMTLYLCQSLFFASSGNSIGWTFIDFVEDLDGMKKLNWVEAICKIKLGRSNMQNTDVFNFETQ